MNRKQYSLPQSWLCQLCSVVWHCVAQWKICMTWSHKLPKSSQISKPMSKHCLAMEVHRNNIPIDGNASGQKAYYESVNLKVDSRSLLRTSAWKKILEKFYKGVLGPWLTNTRFNLGLNKIFVKSGCQLSYYLTIPLTMFVKLTIWKCWPTWGIISNISFT